MSQETVRCPYCVLGSEFRPMFERSQESFVCVACGHTSAPEDPYSKCACSRCGNLNRVATRLSRQQPTPASPS